MTIDFPHKEGERELWTQYRIELSNLPEILLAHFQKKLNKSFMNFLLY